MFDLQSFKQNWSEHALKIEKLITLKVGFSWHLITHLSRTMTGFRKLSGLTQTYQPSKLRNTPGNIRYLIWITSVGGYRKISNISRTKFQNLNDSHLVLQPLCAQSIEARCLVENEDVVGAAPRGDAPTTPEWSTIYCLLRRHLY